VGANNGEHADFVKRGWKSYIASDLRLPEPKILAKLSQQAIDFQLADIEKLPFSSNVFDRVITTCVFHHVDHPEQSIQELIRVCKPGGEISILLPNDPGLSYRLLRKWSSLRRAKKAGILGQAQLEHARQHRNHYLSLKIVIANASKGNIIKISGFPICKPFYDLNLLTRILITKKNSL